MKVSVVIPVYNEEKRIEKTAETLSDFLGNTYDDFEIVFSNDGSVDSTFELATRLGETNEKIKVVGYKDNKGKGCAVRTGILASSGDFIVYTDCDLAYGTEVIKEATDIMREQNADVVIGSRNLDTDSYNGYSFMRKLMSKIYFKLISIMSGFKHSDSQCGFKCFKADVAKEIFANCKIDSFAFDLEALLKAQDMGCNIQELSVKILNNDNRGTKVRMFKDSIKMLNDIRQIKRNK